MKKSTNKSTKKNEKHQDNKNKFLYLVVVVVIFTVAFVLLVNKQNKDNYYLNVKDSNFSVQPEYG